MITPTTLSGSDIRRQRPGWASGSAYLSQEDVMLAGTLGDLRPLGQSLLEAAFEQQFAPLRGLASGWDSYGAPPIDDAAIQAALSLVVDLSVAHLPLPAVVPTSKGGVSLEWRHGPQEIVVEIEPGAGGADVYYSDEEAGVEWDRPLHEAAGAFGSALIRLGR